MQPGYRMRALPATPGNGNALFVATSLSGGGARAAALAYGVMLAMRATTLEFEGHPRTLFDELDIVSAVSGGSLAAGYLAMKGDAMFPASFERVLMRDLHAAFVSDWLTPRQWGWMFSLRFGRGDVLAGLLYREVFEGVRYADVLPTSRTHSAITTGTLPVTSLAVVSSAPKQGTDRTIQAMPAPRCVAPARVAARVAAANRRPCAVLRDMPPSSFRMLQLLKAEEIIAANAQRDGKLSTLTADTVRQATRAGCEQGFAFLDGPVVVGTAAVGVALSASHDGCV